MIGFQLLDIWSKFHRKAIVSYYTDSCACGNKSGKTERSVHGVETSGKLKACLTAHALSHLTHLAWENVTTDHRHHMRQACMFVRAQAAQIVQRMSAVSRHTAD